MLQVIPPQPFIILPQERNNEQGWDGMRGQCGAPSTNLGDCMTKTFLQMSIRHLWFSRFAHVGNCVTKKFFKGFFIQHDPMRMGGKWIKHLLQKWFSILKAIMWFFEIHSATIWFQKHYNESEFCDIWQIITCARYWYWMTFEMLSSRGNWDLIDFLRPPRKYIFGSLLPPHLLCDNHI